MSALIEVRDLTTEFPVDGGRAPIVDSVSFSIERGEVLALVGESGCGKSMTALSVMRLVPRPGVVVRGSVELDGRELRYLSIPDIRQVRGNQISMIFQEPMTSLNPVTRVGDQVVEAIRLHESVDRAAARRRTLELFDRVGIPDPEQRLDAFPHELSGGLKQRVMIAMALSTRPQLLIADEPTTALDVTIQAQILELLEELRRDLGMAILLITHDLGIVNALSDRVAVMYAGRVVEEGERASVLGRARHPYTQGLLRSMPALGRPGHRLDEIPGVVPQPSEWPAGCRFASRCTRVMDVCEGTLPGFTELGEGHRVACHAVEEETR
ncbi:MAG: ABC transporter ATP-binding protein [Myxococcota bacterium]